MASVAQNRSNVTDLTQFQLDLRAHFIGQHFVDLSSATFETLDLQRTLDEDHVTNLANSMGNHGIETSFILDAILMSPESILPAAEDSPIVRNATIAIICGQHRAHAVKKAYNEKKVKEEEALWGFNLYRRSILEMGARLRAWMMMKNYGTPTFHAAPKFVTENELFLSFLHVDTIQHARQFAKLIFTGEKAPRRTCESISNNELAYFALRRLSTAHLRLCEHISLGTLRDVFPLRGLTSLFVLLIDELIEWWNVYELRDTEYARIALAAGKQISLTSKIKTKAGITWAGFMADRRPNARFSTILNGLGEAPLQWTFDVVPNHIYITTTIQQALAKTRALISFMRDMAGYPRNTDPEDRTTADHLHFLKLCYYYRTRWSIEKLDTKSLAALSFLAANPTFLTLMGAYQGDGFPKRLNGLKKRLVVHMTVEYLRAVAKQPTAAAPPPAGALITDQDTSSGPDQIEMGSPMEGVENALQGSDNDINPPSQPFTEDAEMGDPDDDSVLQAATQESAATSSLAEFAPKGKSLSLERHSTRSTTSQQEPPPRKTRVTHTQHPVQQEENDQPEQQEESEQSEQEENDTTRRSASQRKRTGQPLAVNTGVTHTQRPGLREENDSRPRRSARQTKRKNKLSTVGTGVTHSHRNSLEQEEENEMSTSDESLDLGRPNPLTSRKTTQPPEDSDSDNPKDEDFAPSKEKDRASSPPSTSSVSSSSTHLVEELALVNPAPRERVLTKGRELWRDADSMEERLAEVLWGLILDIPKAVRVERLHECISLLDEMPESPDSPSPEPSSRLSSVSRKRKRSKDDSGDEDVAIKTRAQSIAPYELTEDNIATLGGKFPECEVLFVLGAGASAEVGLQTFRNESGQFNRELGSCLEWREFAANSDGEQSKLWTFAAQVLRARRSSRGPTHLLVNWAARHQFICGVITTNIDGLEAMEDSSLGDEVAMFKGLLEGAVEGWIKVGDPRVAYMHGDICTVACSFCWERRPLTLEAVERLISGTFPNCSSCTSRGRPGLTPCWRPDILFYGDAREELLSEHADSNWKSSRPRKRQKGKETQKAGDKGRSEDLLRKTRLTTYARLMDSGPTASIPKCVFVIGSSLGNDMLLRDLKSLSALGSEIIIVNPSRAAVPNDLGNVIWVKATAEEFSTSILKHHLRALDTA